MINFDSSSSSTKTLYRRQEVFFHVFMQQYLSIIMIIIIIHINNPGAKGGGRILCFIFEKVLSFMDYYTLPQESFTITTSGLAVIEVLPFFLLLLILYVVSTLLSKFCITSIAFYFFVYQCNIDLLQPS